MPDPTLAWNSVEDSLPQLGQVVYVVLSYQQLHTDDRRCFVDFRHRVMVGDVWMWNEGTRQDQVTHWITEENILP